ncbi:hypothetical protein ACN47E_000072 [Coniothyrium glycines]
MTSAPLAQSADKSVLFTRLALNQQTHRMLLDDAERARDRLSNNPVNLTNSSRTDPNIRAPYKWDEISETAKHREMLMIVYNSGQDTRSYYQKGHYVTNVSEENWVARWYLWHSFRYRDNRVPKVRHAVESSTSCADGHTGSYAARSYYDPARGHYR